ncbi:MAG: ABC transporter permease [Lachnospiraceae bacterium]|jgi:ribose/xylose/arabinose/galactoside ABC-type transport system permease subunit|nr:ABC transporter permease [Lachnospiraceae bacterium]
MSEANVKGTENKIYGFMKKLSKEYMILIALLIIVLVFSFSSKYFFTANNFMTILLQSATVAIVAIGQAFIMLGGNLDLSLGQNVCLSSYVAAILIKDFGINPWLGLFLCIATAMFIGLINGILVAIVRIPTFIATLGVMNICTGMAKILSKSATISNVSSEISFLGRGYLFGIVPVSAVIMILMFVLASFVAKKTVLGRYIYSIGGNEEAAYFSGISVKKYTLISYVMAGACVGVGAVVLLSRLNAVTISSGNAYEFDAVIGCVLGGISLSGGKGKVVQALFGVIFLMVLFNGMTQLNVNPFVQDVVKGAVLIIAIAIDVLRNRVKN